VYAGGEGGWVGGGGGGRGAAAAAYIHSSRGEPHSSPPALSAPLHHVNLEQF